MLFSCFTHTNGPYCSHIRGDWSPIPSLHTKFTKTDPWRFRWGCTPPPRCPSAGSTLGAWAGWSRGGIQSEGTKTPKVTHRKTQDNHSHRWVSPYYGLVLLLCWQTVAGRVYVLSSWSAHHDQVKILVCQISNIYKLLCSIRSLSSTPLLTLVPPAIHI
jgi:hypothetical protein